MFINNAILKIRRLIVQNSKTEIRFASYFAIGKFNAGLKDVIISVSNFVTP